jgi:hypothetical protein
MHSASSLHLDRNLPVGVSFEVNHVICRVHDSLVNGFEGVIGLFTRIQKRQRPYADRGPHGDGGISVFSNDVSMDVAWVLKQ